MAGRKVAAEGGFVGQRRWVPRVLAAPGVLWLVVFFLTPFYAILSVAMGRLDPLFQTADPVWNPIQWNPTVWPVVFREIFGGNYGETFLRTIAYVGVAALLSVLVGYPVAYYVSRRAGRWKGMLLVLLLAPFWINYLMRMLAWVNLLQTDGWVNRILTSAGLLDQPFNWLAGHDFTVILGLVYGYIPFFILPLYAALDRIDPYVLEAARDLGASPFRAFLRVTLPLSRHGLLAGLVIIMLPMFGDYYTPDLLSGRTSTRMIGNDIFFFIYSPTGGSEGAALTVILMMFVGFLMLYYLLTVARATREAQR